jgi:streptogramin lyase
MGRFRWPGELAIDGDGHVYVTDTGNHRVQVLDQRGHPVVQWSTGTADDDAPRAGIALNRAGHVFVGSSIGLIQQFDPAGRALLAWSARNGKSGQQNGPAGLAVGADDDIFVADRDNHRLLRFRLLAPVTG